MRVISQLADLELEVARIERQGELIVVETAPGQGVETRIELSPRDTGRIAGRILRSPALLMYVLSLPILYWRARKTPTADPPDPWSQE